MKFVTPSYYSTSFSNFVSRTSPSIRAGSFTPALNFMVFVGVIGYVQEYYAIGQYHVAHKHHEVEEALKEYRAKHQEGGHGGH